MIKIGINGFGRTGRCAFRIALKDPRVEIVAINSRADDKMLAHLFKYDSTYGPWPEKVKIEGNQIIIGEKRITSFNFESPDKVPWSEVGAEIVIESTGVFASSDLASAHLKGGAKKVIISAPTKDNTKMIILGVNEKTITPKDKIISMASCTTNCLAPVVKVLNDEFKIESGFCTTIHAVTNEQRLLDKSHKDYRRARGAMESAIPTTTGAARAIGKVIPALVGKLNGVAVRIPLPTVSLLDLVCLVEKKTTTDEVNGVFKSEENGSLSGILSTSQDPLVSADYVGNAFSATVDLLMTKVIGKTIKVMAWYDNEWGYAARLIDLVDYLVKFL